MDKKAEISPSAMNTLLGKGSHLNGTIKVEGGIRIDGELDGNLETNGTLVVGKGALIKAEVQVRDAIIGGKIVGNISATNKIELQSGSYLQGNIKCRGLMIDTDVYFDGTCKMAATQDKEGN